MKRRNFGFLLSEVSRWAKDVKEGADPIEALHGHVCRHDECMHCTCQTGAPASECPIEMKRRKP